MPVNQQNKKQLFNFEQIFLATKSNFYQLNFALISKLTEDLLFRNLILQQELELLFANPKETLIDTRFDKQSNMLLEKCLENSIDHEFVLKILWHRIYQEPFVMKFISMRYSNYSSNLFAEQASKNEMSKLLMPELPLL
jgi:hypothetical protein